MMFSSPFGSRSRTRILVALCQQGSSYPRALARLLDTPIFAVRKALEGLAQDGLVSSRQVGRTRVYTLNGSYVAHRELSAYLGRLARIEADAAGLPPGTASGAPVSPSGWVAVASEGGSAPADTAPGTSAVSPTPSGPRRRPQPSDDGWKNW